MFRDQDIRIMEKDRICKGCTHFEVCPNHYFPDTFSSLCKTNLRKAQAWNLYDKPIDKECLYDEKRYTALMNSLNDTQKDKKTEDEGWVVTKETHGKIIDPSWKAFNHYAIDPMPNEVLGIALDLPCYREDMVITIAGVFEVKPDKAANRNRCYKIGDDRKVEFNLICWKPLPRPEEVIEFEKVECRQPSFENSKTSVQNSK